MPKFEDRMRLVCNLGKIQILKVDSGKLGTKFVAEHMASGLKLNGNMPFKADVRRGDILTLYTEVLADEHPGDKPTNPAN